MFKRKTSGKAKGNPKKLWEAYLKASLKQDWTKARDALQSIINLEPNNSKTHLKMGDLLQKLGDSKGAIKAYHNSASILLNSGFNQKALALYKIILRLDPKDKQALNDTKRLAESARSATTPLPAFSAAAESPVPSQPEETVTAPEEFTVYEEATTVPEEVSELDDMAPSERMPPPADLMSTEGAELGNMPPEGLPASDEIPSGWPDLEASTAPQEEDLMSEFDIESAQVEEDVPGFETESSEPQVEDAMPEFDIESAQVEEDVPGFETESSEAGSEDSLIELCIGSSDPIAGEALDDNDMDTPVTQDREKEEWTGTLPEIFWSLNKEELTQIFNDSVIASYAKGQTIVEEGDAGDSIFAIMDGSAMVQTNVSGKTVNLAVLKAGDVFGEVAFLTGKPRTATVVANSDIRVMDMSRAVLEKAIEKHPRILSCLAEYYYERLNDTITKVKKAKMPKVHLTVRQ